MERFNPSTGIWEPAREYDDHGFDRNAEASARLLGDVADRSRTVADGVMTYSHESRARVMYSGAAALGGYALLLLSGVQCLVVIALAGRPTLFSVAGLLAVFATFGFAHLANGWAAQGEANQRACYLALVYLTVICVAFSFAALVEL